ncbi:hypothetical protein VOLCADRAFT_102959 [Volvox carteri f. nagariensis]|uniref:Uncharacterized protein n=1 Tax=Volvox carteri f. nagariensis TaxID=3068 RepID=D8TJ22_VOLCA|nr:uncharacterized protein VOLCADRAFT_102959 [Volvox carteri f. nagariensis]EFJ52464.1 hypothetical protein VOLCADRAFT_102959 [Volvox carteri f. nagariensis]|eukprot:XP_002946537.1 hypothetical protein VOLCADRAFT_102959 [Volvox carteri f. nagariensis]
MGNCCGCCEGDKPNKGGQGGYATFQGSAQGGSGETEKDRAARLLAAERAEQRQKQFEQSAVGKAAYRQPNKQQKQEHTPGPAAKLEDPKSQYAVLGVYLSVQEVKDAKKAGGGNTGQPTAADWRDYHAPRSNRPSTVLAGWCNTPFPSATMQGRKRHPAPSRRFMTRHPSPTPPSKQEGQSFH